MIATYAGVVTAVVVLGAVAIGRAVANGGVHPRSGRHLGPRAARIALFLAPAPVALWAALLLAAPGVLVALAALTGTVAALHFAWPWEVPSPGELAQRRLRRDLERTAARTRSGPTAEPPPNRAARRAAARRRRSDHTGPRR